MNSAVIKSLVGVGAVGSACAGAYGLHVYSSPKTVQDKLFRDGFKLLDLSVEDGNKDSQEWNEKITEYKKTQSNLPKFDASSSITDASKLKEECKKVLEINLSETGSDQKVEQAKLWCFKGTLKNLKPN